MDFADASTSVFIKHPSTVSARLVVADNRWLLTCPKPAELCSREFKSPPLWPASWCWVNARVLIIVQYFWGLIAHFIFIELYLWVGVTGGTEEGVWLLYNIHSWCHTTPHGPILMCSLNAAAVQNKILSVLFNRLCSVFGLHYLKLPCTLPVEGTLHLRGFANTHAEQRLRPLEELHLAGPCRKGTSVFISCG